MQSYLHRKESIILTAIEIIDELGIMELSSREIARRQGISEGTIFRHFNTKNEIIFGVLEYYSKFDTDIIDSVKLRGASIKDSMEYFMSSFAEYYENYPAITAIPYNFEVLLYDNYLGKKVKEITNTRSDFIKYLLDKGKENGELSGDIDSEFLADAITGFFRTTILKWRIEGHNFNLKDRILKTLKMLVIFS